MSDSTPPTAPTAASIAATLRQNLSAQGVLTLADDAFGAGILTELFDTFLTDKTLTIDHATVSDTATGAVVTGDGAGTFAGTKVQAEFTAANDTVTLALHATLPASWKISSALPALAGTAVDNLPSTGGSLILQSDDQGAVTPNSFLLDANFNLAAAFHTYGWLLGTVGGVHFSGAIQMTNDTPTFSFTTALTSGLTVGTLQQLPLSLVLSSTAGDAGPAVVLEALSSLALPVGATPAIVPLTLTLDPTKSTGQLIADLSTLGSATLDAFSGVTGGAALSSILPAGSPLLSSSLFSHPGLTFDLALPSSDGGKASMTSLELEVGMPAGTSWTLFNNVSAADLRFIFKVTDPAGARTVSGGFKGELAVGAGQPPVLLDVDATAAKGNSSINGQLHTGSTIDLRSLVTLYIPSATWLPAISLDTLKLSAAYADQATTADFNVGLSSDWKVPVGPTSLSITTVTGDLNYASKALSGKITGTLGIGSETFTATCAVPGGFKIEGTIASIKLSGLQRALTNVGISLPPGFDLTLTNSTVFIQTVGGDAALVLGTQFGDTGSMAFATTRQGAQWGFALGLKVATGKLATVPGLSGLAIFEKAFGFQDAVLIVCSQPMANFTFPDLAEFKNPGIDSAAITVPAQAGGLQRGFNFYATMDLKSGTLTKPLANLLKLSTAAITIVVGANPATDATLMASVSGNITSNLPLTGLFQIQVANGVLSFTLRATVPTRIQGQPVTFNASMQVVGTGGAVLSGDATGTFHFHVVTLSNPALAIGINAAGIPSLGVAATIVSSDFSSSVAIFFDSTMPTQSMFLGAVSDLTLATIVKTFAGAIGQPIPSQISSVLQQVSLRGLSTATVPVTPALVTALDSADVPTVAAALAAGNVKIPSDQTSVLIVAKQKGRSWSLTDLSTQYHYQLAVNGPSVSVLLEAQVYCAPQGTQISTLNFRQGVHLFGQLNVFGVSGTAKIEISVNQGISADAWMTPVKVLGGSFLSITDASGTKGPFLSLGTYTNPAQTDPKKQPPHFLLSGSISMLGISQQSVDASITTGGILFTLNSTSGPASYTVSATVGSLSNITASGNATIQVGTLNLGPFGSLPLNTGVSLTLSAGFNGSAVTGNARGSASLLGQSVAVNLGLDVSGNTITSLPGRLVGYLQDQAKGMLSGNVNLFLNAVKNGTLQGFSDAQKVGEVLAQQFRLAPNAIATQTKNVLGYGATQIAGALKGAGVAPDQIGNILYGLGYKVSDIASAIGTWFKGVKINFALPHVDTWVPPHIDTNQHVDTPAGPHADSHADIRWVVDKHVDTRIPPHLDTTQHVDTPRGVHTDIGHIDLG